MRRRKKSIQWEPLLAVGLLTVFLVWGWGASESSANILTSVTPNNPCDDVRDRRLDLPGGNRRQFYRQVGYRILD